MTADCSTEELRERLSTVTLVEALGPAFFATGHLPGAVNIPPLRVAALAPRLLPGKDAPIVVYGAHRGAEPPTATSSGTSNFGSFTPTLSHCITLPLSTSSPNIFDLGEFIFTFEDGDTLFGTYSGELTFLSAGVFSVFQTHIVTGGTGTFLDASGTFTSSGTLTFPGGRPTVQQSFSGLLNVPAVPEPSTWLMMLTGFMAIGARVRAKRRASVRPATA